MTPSMGTLFDRAPDFYDAVEAAPPTNIVEMPVRKTLREHLSDVDAIADTIEALDAEDLTDEARDELSRMLIAAIAGTKKKIDNATSCLAMWDGLEAAANAEITRLNKRASTFARQRDRLESYLIAVLEASKLTKLEGNTSAIALRLNPPAVIVEDAAKVPHEFLRYPDPPPPSPDKPAIKKALASGRVVIGCRLERGKKLVRS
jgi:hypothetical protein